MTIERPAQLPRQKRTKTAIALLLTLLLLVIAGNIYLSRPKEPEPVTTEIPEPTAQGSWFSVLTQLEALPAPAYKCATYTEQTFDMDGFPMTADTRVEGEPATFLFATAPTQEQLFPTKGEGVPFEACTIQLTDVYVQRDDGVRVPDFDIVESKLNAMGYSNDEENAIYSPAPMVDLTMNENAADAFRVEISTLPQFVGDITTNEDGSRNITETSLLSIPFRTGLDAPAEEIAELRNRVSDGDYALLTAYATAVTESAASEPQ
jgi:hypothetical protein